MFDISYLIIPPLLFISLMVFDIFDQWGKESSGQKEKIFGYERPILVWKNWKDWLWLEILLSPIFIVAYVGMGMLYLFLILIAATFLNPVSTWLGKLILRVLSTKVVSR